MKLKKLDIWKVNESAFTNRRSYTAALFAISTCNQIIEHVNKGHIVFDKENIIVPFFKLEFDNDNFISLVLKDSENCHVMIVGDETVDDKIYCSIKTIREYFKHWRMAEITKVTNVSTMSFNL